MAAIEGVVGRVEIVQGRGFERAARRTDEANIPKPTFLSGCEGEHLFVGLVVVVIQVC